MSTLSLTPINEAWSKPLDNQNSPSANMYSTPEMHNTILSDLGMIETKQSVPYKEPDQKKDSTRNVSITNSNSKIIHMPLPQDDPKQRQPDISLAKEKLNGWEPTIELKEGLGKTIAYFESIL